MFTEPRVSFLISNVVLGPDSFTSNGALHVPAELLEPDGNVGANPEDRVGSGMGVGLGKGVSEGSGVGGTAVAVGMAAWVRATMVLAAATAEACTCAGSIVGAAWGPQAASRTASTMAMNVIRFILYLSRFLLV